MLKVQKAVTDTKISDSCKGHNAPTQSTVYSFSSSSNPTCQGYDKCCKQITSNYNAALKPDPDADI